MLGAMKVYRFTCFRLNSKWSSNGENVDGIRKILIHRDLKSILIFDFRQLIGVRDFFLEHFVSLFK